MKKQSNSFDWVRELKPNLKNLDSIPLTGATPPFPWEELATRLAHSFDRKGLTIQTGEITWRAKENLFEGLGDSPIPLNFAISPIKGQVSWLMPEQEMATLVALLLTKESHPLSLNDHALNESFYHFLALEVLYHLSQVSFDKTLTPLLLKQTALPNEDSLCWDISLSLQDQTIWGRLIISPEFRQSWVEHFAHVQEATALSQKIAESANVIVHLEAGKTQLSLKEWKSVQPGDFILLDSCSLDSETLLGRVMLTINGKPVFRAKLKEDTLKILEFPLLHEVETPMAKEPQNEDDLNEFDESEEDFEDEDFFMESDENDLFSEEEEEEEEVETEEEQEILGSVPRPSEEEGLPEEKSKLAAPTQKIIKPEQIPVTLTVEVGQIQMTMDQLLKLEPGNLLDVSIHPENGVDLTINGKVVGKGELIRIGEALGVRILEVG